MPSPLSLRNSFFPAATFSIFALNFLSFFLHTPAWYFSLSVFLTKPWLLWASMFSHNSLEHLMGNMLFLVLFGPVVEKRLGATKMAGLYLFAGALGHMVYAGFHPLESLVGASGAVAGLICVYPFVQTNWVSKLVAGLVVGFLLFNEFTMALLVGVGGTATVGYLAHVAGAFGGLLALAWYGKHSQNHQ